MWYTIGVKGIEMSADRVMAYLRSVPKPLKKNKKIIENPLTNSPTCAIIQIQGARKTKVACECVGTEVKWLGEESNPFCPILGADKGSSVPTKRSENNFPKPLDN